MYGSDDYIDGSDVPSDGFYESKANESIEEHYQEWKSSISSAWLDKTEDNWIAYAKSMIGYSEDEAKDQWEKWHYLTKPINESEATDDYEVDVDEYIETGEPVEKLPEDKRKHDSLNFDPSYEAETSDAEYEDWIQDKTDEDTTRDNLEKLQEETVEESFGDCGCKMTNKAKETWEGLTDSDKQLELRDMGVDEGYAYYPFEHLPKKIGEAFVDKFNIEENGDSLGWNKITALERADTLRKIGFTPRDSELVSNLEYQQLSESLKKDVNEALNYKVKAQESQVPQGKSQETFENGLYSNMYDGYLERRGSRVESKKKQKILENNNFGLNISKVKGVESKYATETYYVEWANGGFFETEDMDEAKQKAKDNDGKVFLDDEQVYPAEESKASENIADFKSELDTAWFDRSGDTDGIAVGRQNELKYANADDFETKNPSLFERMYKHWINNPDDTFDDDSSFSWESKANEYLPDHFDLDEQRMEEQDEDLSLEDRVICRYCGKKYDLEEYEHEDLDKHLLEIHNIRNVDESKATEKSFSELRRIADDIWENQLDRDTKITILNQSGVWWDDSEFEERADYSIDRLGGLGLEPVNVNELVDIIFDYADDDPREESGESKANEIKNYLGIELDSISQMIDKIRNGTIDNHHLSRFADYHGLPEGWTKEDIIDEIRVYEGMEDELDFEGREDGEISQIRSLLYGYESKATERDFYRSNKEISDQGDDIQAEAEFGKKYSELSDSEKGYIEYIKNEFGDVKSYDQWVTSGTEAQVMGTPMTNYDRFGREWGFSIINHGYGEGSETPYEVGIFLHDEIHKKNDVKGWLNEEEALYYKAKFEVDPIDAFRSIGGQMDSIVNPDFVEQTEDNWNLWESLNTDGDRKRIRDWHGNTGTVDDDGNVVDDRTLIGSLEEASLSDPDNKKYNMDTDFGFSYSDKDIEALDAETDVELSVDNEANQNRDEDGQFTSDLPEEKNEDYGKNPYSGKVNVPFVEAKESKSKAEEAFDKGASAEKIYSLVDDKGTDDDRSESEEEYLNNLYNKTNANKSAGFSDLQ